MTSSVRANRRDHSSAFGLRVERRRQVVEHEQLGPREEHARRGGALDLSAGQLHAARADERVEPALERRDVRIEHGRVDRRVERGLIVGTSEQEVRRAASR